MQKQVKVSQISINPIPRYYRYLLAFKFAIDEINSNIDILPNVTLGYHATDSCRNVNKAVESALHILSGPAYLVPNYLCQDHDNLVGIIGDHSSETSFCIAEILNIYRYLQISYGSTNPLLTNKQIYPSFFQTLPSDQTQYLAIVKLLKHFGWTWIGIITSDDDAGEKQSHQLQKQAAQHEDITVGHEKTLIVPASPVPIYHIKVQGKSSFHGSLVFSQPVKSIPCLKRFLEEVILENYGNDSLLEYIIALFFDCTTSSPSIDKKIEILYKMKLHKCNYTVPVSICSEDCPPGYRSVMKRGIHRCCFNCLPCSEGEISNETDKGSCHKCPEDQWPNDHNKCEPKPVEYLSYNNNTMVLLVSILSAMCFLKTAIIFGIFIVFQDSPIVKANNKNLSLVLLVSIMLSFLCVFLFLGRPVCVSCMLRQTSFGIIFTVAISSILAKTITVYSAFKATKPGSSWRIFVGVKMSYCLVLVCLVIQIVIAIVWLFISPPFPERNVYLYIDKIIIQCNEGSMVAFSILLGYMGVLAVISFFVAFLARNLPNSFNEAKYITFSMLVFCSVWVAFVPAYISSTGKNTVLVEIFAILCSTAGILGCIFFPKCYNILVRPDLNSRTNLLTKTHRRHMESH
ncbi:vomeronasal type-2 receptor 26-like [Mantella aurantiaca]